MGVIGTSIIDINGHETHTKVYTNAFDELVIRIAKRFGHKRLWRVIHHIEKRKLRKQ